MEQITNYIESLGLKIGIVDNRLKQFNQATIKKVLNNFFGDSTDIDIKYKCKDYVLEFLVLELALYNFLSNLCTLRKDSKISNLFL